MSETHDEHGMPLGRPLNPAWEVSPRTVAAMLERGTGLLLDCREHEEFATARIEGAVLVPMGEVADRLDEIEDLVDSAGEGHIVVHCHGGVRSLKVAAFLRERGIDGVVSMAGGIDLWSLDVDAGVPRY